LIISNQASQNRSFAGMLHLFTSIGGILGNIANS
jgi:hypothetical protein